MRLGAQRAVNLDIAESQWSRVLIAAEGLTALAAVEELPAGRRRDGPEDSFAYD